MNIFAYNPDLLDAEKTSLSSAIAATVTTTVLKVRNSNNFVNTRRILIGAPKRERSEMGTQTAKTATTITVGTTNFSHDSDDPVYALDFDQIKFYRSTTGVNGTYSILATVDMDWDNLNGKTVYNDANALTSYFYKVSFFDSIGGAETPLSEPIQSTGYPDNSVGDTILQMVTEVNDKHFLIFDIPDYIGIMNNISKDLYKQAKRPYRFLKVNFPMNVTAGAVSVPFPTDIWKINYVEVNQLSSSSNNLTFKPKKVDITTMRFRLSQLILPSDYVNEIAFDDEAKVMYFHPSARTDRIGAFNFHYYKKFTKFTDLSNLLETPDNLVYQYGLKRAYYLRRMDDDAKWASQFAEYDKMYQAEIRMMQREKTLEAGGPSGMGPDRKRYLQYGGPRYRQ